MLQSWFLQSTENQNTQRYINRKKKEKKQNTVANLPWIRFDETETESALLREKWSKGIVSHENDIG